MDVPLEVWDHIFKNLHDNPPALLACTLVCRAWLPIARGRVFHSIHLSGRIHSSRFVQLLDMNPDISSHIRRLTIRFHDHSYGEHISQILLRMVYLQNLSITSIITLSYLQSRFPYQSICTGGAFATIKNLHLQHLSFAGMDLPRILHSCVWLSSLHLEAISWHYVYPDDTQHLKLALPVIHKSTITDLCLISCTPNVARLLLSGLFQLDLSVLKLRWEDQAKPHVAEIARLACTSLQRFTLSMQGVVRMKFPAQLPTLLASFPRLRVLRLQDISLLGPARIPYQAIAAIVEEAVGLPLRELRMDMEIISLDRLGILHWARLDAALAQLGRNGCQPVFRAKLPQSVGRRGLLQLLSSKLPRLRAEGVPFRLVCTVYGHRDVSSQRSFTYP